MHPAALAVLDQMNRLLGGDGGSVKLKELSGGIATIEYHPSSDDDCEMCVMSSEDLAEFVLEAFKARSLAIDEVKVIDV